MAAHLTRRSLVAMGAASALGVRAQAAYPARPLMLQIPFSAGSGNDLVGRAVGRKLAEFLGHPVVVENRAGASGSIATDYTRRSAQDGYTLLLASASFSINPHTTGAKYTVADFTPVAMVGSLPFALVASKSLPVANVKELLELVKRNPDKFSGGQGDVNGTNFILMEQLKKAAGTNVVSVTYKGTPEALLDLQADRIHMMFSPVSTAIQHHRAGNVKILGISGARRSPVIPEMPTFHEQGFPKLDLSTWFGVLGPAGIPAAVVNTLSSSIAKAVAAPDVVESLVRLGISPAYSGPAEFDAFLKADAAMWGTLVKEAGIKPN